MRTTLSTTLTMLMIASMLAAGASALPGGSGLIVKMRVPGVGQEASPDIREEMALVGLAGDVHTLVSSVPIICTQVALSPDGTKLAISAHNCRM